MIPGYPKDARHHHRYGNCAVDGSTKPGRDIQFSNSVGSTQPRPSAEIDHAFVTGQLCCKLLSLMVYEEVSPDRASAWSLPELVVTVCLGQEFRLEVIDDSADGFDQNESPEKWKAAGGRPSGRASRGCPEFRCIGRLRCHSISCLLKSIL